MAHIRFENVSIGYPIYNARGRSLKSVLLESVTGGKLDSDSKGVVTIQALRNLTFQLNDGDRLAILGHNGAGKSTLLRAINGVYSPTYGHSEINGSVSSLIDISLGINPEATGRENIFTRSALLGIPRKTILGKLDEVIEFSELGKFIDLPVRTYSTGMQMRLGFAVSTITESEILLMDEWLSVGDENFRHKAETKLNEIVEKTNILVLASHTKDLILKTCNKAMWLQHGELREFGDVGLVANNYFESQVQ